MSKVIHYAVLLLLVVGGLVYWWMKPPGINPITDPRAAEALALVQTHRAAGYPTILQAFNERDGSSKWRREIAEGFAAEGARVAIWDIAANTADVAAEIPSAFGQLVQEATQLEGVP